MSDRSLTERMQQLYSGRLAIGDRWDDPAFVYSWWHELGYYLRDASRSHLLALLKRNGIRLAGKRILDIGCGTGDWLRFFAELVGDCRGLHGVDITSHSLQRGYHINPTIVTAQADARRVPFVSGQFDVISQFVTFEHLMDRADLASGCAEIKRLAAPGAILIWMDLLPVVSDYQRGFTLAEVAGLFPSFGMVDHCYMYPRLKVLGKQISPSTLVYRSRLLASAMEQIGIGQPTNMIAVLKNAE